MYYSNTNTNGPVIGAFSNSSATAWTDVRCNPGGGGGEGTSYNGLYGEASPERGTFFKLQVYKRVGISRVQVNKRVGKSVFHKVN